MFAGHQHTPLLLHLRVGARLSANATAALRNASGLRRSRRLAGQLGGPARRHSGSPRIAASRIGSVMSSECTASLMCDWPGGGHDGIAAHLIVVAAIRIKAAAMRNQLCNHPENAHSQRE